MAIRAVVFDLFDTLVDLYSENLPMEEHHGAPLPASVRPMHAAMTQGADVPFDVFTRAFVDSRRSFVETHFSHDREVPTLLLFQDVTRRLALSDPELPKILTDTHMGVLRSVVAVPHHHAEVLSDLHRNARLGLCSNFSHSETALGILDDAGLLASLDAVVVSDAFGLRKPRREIFDEVLTRLGAAPEDVIHVGDNLGVDVAGAAELGIRTVWITRRVRDPEARLREHTGPPPDCTIADLAELPLRLHDFG